MYYRKCTSIFRSTRGRNFKQKSSMAWKRAESIQCIRKKGGKNNFAKEPSAFLLKVAKFQRLFSIFKEMNEIGVCRATELCPVTSFDIHGLNPISMRQNWKYLLKFSRLYEIYLHSGVFILSFFLWALGFEVLNRVGFCFFSISKEAFLCLRDDGSSENLEGVEYY